MTPEIKQQIEQIRRGEVPEGFKHNSASVMPCDWNTCDFHEVATIQSGLVSPKEEPYCFMFHIGPDNIERDTGRIGNLKTACELGLVSGKFYFDAGSIVYSKIRPNLNKVCIPNFEGICSADCYSIKARAGIDRDYLFNLMLSFPFYRRAVACSMRTGMPKINQDDLNAIPVVMPSQLEEQQKIAAILTTQDKVIELKEKLLAEKQRQKKYLMQVLLTGKKRLPRFSGEWKVNRLRNIATRHTKRNTIGNTNALTISAQYGLINQAEFFNKAVASDDKSNYFLLEKGDFAYNKSYSNGYPFGAIKRLTRYEVGIVSPLYICFRIKEGSVSGEYLEQYFEAGLMNHELQAFAQEGARNHGLLNIAVDDFFNSKILLPSPEEQTSIAEIFSTADREIDLLRQDIEQEKQKKKALMQLLLTGIVRVNE